MDSPATRGTTYATQARTHARQRLRAWCDAEIAELSARPLWTHRWESLGEIAAAADDPELVAVVIEAGMRRWQQAIDQHTQLLRVRGLGAWRLRRHLGFTRADTPGSVRRRRDALIASREAWVARIESPPGTSHAHARSIADERGRLEDLAAVPLADLLAAGDLVGARDLARAALVRFPAERTAIGAPGSLAAAARLVRAYRHLSLPSPPLPLLEHMARINTQVLRTHQGDRIGDARSRHGYSGADLAWRSLIATRDATELAQRVWACAEGQLGRAWHQTFIVPLAADLHPDEWEPIIVRDRSQARYGYRMGFRRDSINFDVIGVSTRPPIGVAGWEWKRTDRLAQRLGARDLRIHEVYPDSGAAMVFGIVTDGARVTLDEHYPPVACAHPHAMWEVNSERDTLTRHCPSCLRRRLGAVALHRLPDDHPALVGLDTNAYLDRERFHRALAGDRRAVSDWEQLRSEARAVHPNQTGNTATPTPGPRTRRPTNLSEAFFGRLRDHPNPS